MNAIGFDVLVQTPGFRRAYLLRGFAVWVMIRMGYAYVQGVGLGVLQVAFVVAMASGVVIVDARRRNEDLFLANLGVSRWAIALLSMTLPLGLELLLQVRG